MRKYLTIAVLSSFVSVFLYAHAVPQKASPGLERFSPTRIDWLTTTLQADLREELTRDRGFSMDLTYNGDEPGTVVIYIRYLPDMSPVGRADIETARSVIGTAAKRYGWENWVKVKEDIKAASKAK